MILRTAPARVRDFLLTHYWRVAPTSPKGGLSPSQIRLLRGLLRGDTLKSHRYLDGGKEYRLHPINGEATQVPAQDVCRLEKLGLLLSNHKFPATTLFLSPRGRRAAENAKETAETPPSANISATTL